MHREMYEDHGAMAKFTPSRNRLVYAAIDFGTTFSGYAYAFRDDLKKNPPLILTNDWNDGCRISSKSPTTVLFEPNKEFHSFGSAAEDKYVDLARTNEHKTWFYFKRFKMTLHSNETLSRTTQLVDEYGKEMLALDVFSAAIEFMKNHLMTEVHKKVDVLLDSDVQWVVTVPAIWNDGAKQFMREAVEKAGIAEDQLILAYEPEVAAIYCQKVERKRSVSSTGARFSIAEPGSKCVVLDLGGGTADVTVLETVTKDELRHLHMASGGAWGGTRVDSCFLDFLTEIFGGATVGNKVMSAFKNIHMEDYIDLMRDFEIKKRDERITTDCKISIRLPSSLIALVEKENTVSIDEVLQESKYGPSVSKAGDKLRIRSAVFATLFNDAIGSIVNHFKTLFHEENLSNIETLVLVGGFSASTLVQREIRHSFPGKSITIPKEPDMSVLKGAVIFGYNQKHISSRIPEYTYGVGVVWTADLFGFNLYRSENVFRTLVESGKVIRPGTVINATKLCPLEADQKSMYVPIFASKGQNPKYTTDPGCKKLGKITVDMPDITGGKSRIVTVRMSFSGTEIGVEAVDETTKKTFKTRVNFLG